MKKKIIYPLTLVIFLFGAMAAFAERLSISAPIANIRSGPGTKHAILWNVEKYYPIKVVEKKGVWYHFEDFDKDKGWVHQSVVDKTPSVITNTDKSNIRSGPGSNHPVVFSVERAVPFKVLKKQGNWINIEHADGDKGWIHKSLVW